jgi:divalent metal cation (Fe/Co/Zn/Cd) transporter
MRANACRKWWGTPSLFFKFQKQALEKSVPGIVIAVLSLLVMPVLSRAKRRVAGHLSSRAVKADARQADFCALSLCILLTGLLLNALFG